MGARGLFLTLEGLEGAGKTTQAQLVRRAVEQVGRSCLLTFEPGGGGPVGDALRRLLKDPDCWRSMKLAEVYLYAASRAHHLESMILPALTDGQVVVCDRFLDSTRAYQGYGRGRPLPLIEAIHALPPLDAQPDRTILLDLDPELGLARARGRGEAGAPGYDDEDLAFFHRVRRGFRAIAREAPDRVRTVDASGAIAEVHGRVIAALIDLLPGLAPVGIPP